ncbi:MAG: hypothetical protein ACFHU9_03295 [Fluviicola sp.]
MEDTVHESFELTLDQVMKGSSELKNPVCSFSYTWDNERNMGIANLTAINGTPVNIILHPLGIAGQLDFMSDMEPTGYNVDADPGEAIAIINIIIYRVILDIEGDSRKAAFMLGEDGGTIITSKGFSESSTAKQLPAVEFEAPEAPEGVEPPTAE